MNGFDHSLDLGDIGRRVGTLGCNRIQDPFQRELCMLGVDVFTGAEQSELDAAARDAGVDSCPDGFEERDGDCVRTGMRGTIERTLPGGRTGTMSDVFGDAVIGAFGIPAIVPADVGSIQRADGSVGPILRCPPGAVLGKDSLCYMKGSIPVQFRKHRPSPRPLLSAADGKTLRRAKTLEKKLKRVSSKFLPRPRARGGGSRGVITKAEAARALRK